MRTLRARVAAVVASSLALILVLGVGGWAFSQRTAARPLAAISPRPSPSLSTPSPAPSDSPSPTPSPPASPPAAPPPPRPASAPAHPPAAAPPAPPPPPPGPPPVTTNVPWYHQQYNLSCEESSLSMVLAFFGHPTSDQQVLDFVGVDSVHYWAGRPGGGNPFVNFVGDPNGSEVQQTGYGVYWPPIKAAATHFGAAVATAGQGIAPGAIYDAVRAGHPAVVWLTFDLKPHTRTDYQAFDGQTIPYAGPWEHAMVVTGINGNSVRVNDPDRGQYWVAFGTFEASYAVYGQMAVIFAGGVATPAPTPTPTPVPTPTPTPMPTPTPTPVPTATSTP